MDADAHERSDARAEGDLVVDLTDGGAGFSPADVLRWLRTSGGSLYERTMKCAAAQLLESSLGAQPPAPAPAPPRG